MSQLSDYRIRIKNLLAADDIEQALVLEGVSTVGARAIGVSRAVIAQRSILRKEVVQHDAGKREPTEHENEPSDDKDH